MFFSVNLLSIWKPHCILNLPLLIVYVTYRNTYADLSFYLTLVYSEMTVGFGITKAINRKNKDYLITCNYYLNTMKSCLAIMVCSGKQWAGG